MSMVFNMLGNVEPSYKQMIVNPKNLTTVTKVILILFIL